MANISVDSFIRIFKFYQANPLVKKERDSTGKIKLVSLNDTFRNNSLIYQDTIDVYLHSLTMDKLTQLSYENDSDTIQYALNAREKLSKYFSRVLYPGSYAFSTLDNASIRRMILDWSSTIKTIQDSNKRVTDAYSLNSNDVDKAIRGFGVDFINSTTIKSIDRRKNFLLNMCDLYSIKGSPNSIIEALNIIGLNNIFIREAWMCKDVEKYNGDYDIRIRWAAQKIPQEFDSVTNSWVELNTHDDIYTTWDWFMEKINNNTSSFDPHWFYTQDEIKLINNKPDTFMKLPSITPYFGIEFTSDMDKNIDSFSVLFNELNTQFQTFIINGEKIHKTIWVDSFPTRINALECYTALIYTLIRVDEHVQYENFKSFLELNKFDTPQFEKPYEYFKLIYWMYQHKNDIFEASYNKLLNDYIPLKSNTYTCYENVLRWWLTEPVNDFERLGTYNDIEEKWDNKPFITDALYIQPTCSKNEYANYIELDWENPYPFGTYCVESYNSEDGWLEIVSNASVYDTKMHCAVTTDYAQYGSDDVTMFRIVLYHHSQNIPEIFFHQPFNFNGNPTNNLMDRVVRYNGPLTTTAFYDRDDPIRQIFINEAVEEKSVTYDVVNGYHGQEASGNTRITQIHDDIKSYYSSAYNYPAKTKLLEDKWLNINSTFYDYVDWSTTDYYDTITHNGLLESNIVRDRKWPINKKWNWAIDTKYYYVNYESNKWMRYPVDHFEKANGLMYRYGDRIIDNGILRVYVANNTWAIITGTDIKWNTNESDILTNGKIKEGSKLSRDLAVGQIKNSEIVSLLYNLTHNDKQSELYKDSIKQLNSITIEVHSEPYGNDLVTSSSYTYESFLTYLYNCRLTLDFDSGYIYPVIEGTVDNHCHVYLKCHNLSNKTLWIRFNNSRDNIEWNDCEGCQSIYNDDVNLGSMIPPYSLPNRYDSLRILDGRIFNYRKELIEAYEAGTIPDDVNLVIVRPYKTTDGKYSETDDKYKNKTPLIYKKVQTITTTGTIKLTYEWQPLEVNRLQDCNVGLNPDLIDWIESMFESNAQNFVDLPSIFAESLNSYLINDLGVEGSLIDLIIASWSNSSIVKKIVNFYKPKRARLLFVSDALDSEHALSNGTDSLVGLTDCDYNYYDLITYRWGNSDFDIRNLSRMNRTKITQVLHDYTPVEDTIYKDRDDSNKVFNHREIHSPESKIPEIEVYDSLVDINRHKIATRNGIATASFYLHNMKYDDTINGFYYEITLDGGKKIYSNNSWYFQKSNFVYKFTEGRTRTVNRWALFRADNNSSDSDDAFYVADHDTGTIDSTHDYPWICDDGKTAIKYGNCTSHDRFINNYDYSEGDFLTQRFIKTGVRNIQPVIYFRCFENEACNGFYYYDAQIHPDRNDCPVYYNLKGKMISLVDTKHYYSRIDPTTGHNVSAFWCITDYKQIVDFTDCDYFAFATSRDSVRDVTIFDPINDNFTKQFHRLNPVNDTQNSNYDSAMVGMKIGFLYEHQDLIRDNEGHYTAEYDKYTNYRRNSVNTIRLKYEPISCLVSDGVTVINYFNHSDELKKIHYGNENQIDSNAILNLVIDDLGNEKGAFRISDSNVVLTSQMNNATDWTISMRIRFNNSDTITNLFDTASDLICNRWYMVTYTSNNKLFINGKSRNDITQKFISYGKVEFIECNCDIAEFGIWDYILTDWYINVISNFRILRNRPEVNKSKTNKSSGSFRPLFAQEQPRIVCDRWATGLPENTVGGRLQEYFCDKYKGSREENPLWVNRVHHKLEDSLIVKGSAYNQPTRDSINFGKELQSSGDYITPNNKIQWWWMRYNKDFRTGPIHHRPVYVSAKEIIDDPYPTVKHGQEITGNYYDMGLRFDGVDTTNPQTYDDETYDENTGFGFKYDSKIKIDNPGSNFKSIITTENITIPDLDQLSLTSKTMRNFIFHKTLYIYDMDKLYNEFNGVWTHSDTVKSWKPGDFKECYRKGDNYEAVFTYHDEVGYFWWEIRKLNEDNEWETYFRSYVNAKHNQSRQYYVYDLLNYHQIDLADQKLCKFKENEFVDKCWSQVKQEEISGKFACNSWTSFIIKPSNEKTHIGYGNYFDGTHYHMVFDDKWYKVTAEEKFEEVALLPKYRTPSGFVYLNNYLYIWISDDDSPNIINTYTDATKYQVAHKIQAKVEGYWIRIACNDVSVTTYKVSQEQWKFVRYSNNIVIVNVLDASNATISDDTYISGDVIDIQETVQKLIKFNGLNDWKWEDHMNEEFPYLKSVNNHISATIASVKDTLLYTTYETNSGGNYIKVMHSNGVIDFSHELMKNDIRVGDKRYIKLNDLSNV